MGHSPFAKSSGNVSPPVNRRRSTRIEHVAPIVISGKNASGQPFREATETLAVSAHGAAFRTHNPILIGMQLMVENVLDGVAEKAICVRVVEAEAGEGQNVIAVQLLHPKNIWGVEDPPADWQFALGAAQPEPVPAPQAGPPSLAARETAPSSTAAVPPSSAVPPPGDFDQRAAEFAESVLVLLRRQAAGMLRDSLREFEERLKALESETLQRVTRHSETAVKEAGSSLNQLRERVMEKIVAQADQTASIVEERVRERITAMFTSRPQPQQEFKSEKKMGTD